MNFHPELPTPPPLAEGTLRMVALGGLGEVGRNMHVIEYNGRLLIIDCGVLFPEENQPGVDLVLPDLSYLEDRLEDIEAAGPHARPRGPHRCGAVPAPHAPRHPDPRLAADARVP